MAKKVRRPRTRRVETVSTTAEAAETTPSKSMTDQEVFESDYAYLSLLEIRFHGANPASDLHLFAVTKCESGPRRICA
jgi:hypothetical protein